VVFSNKGDQSYNYMAFYGDYIAILSFNSFTDDKYPITSIIINNYCRVDLYKINTRNKKNARHVTFVFILK